jgi:hypothetical protein
MILLHNEEPSFEACCANPALNRVPRKRKGAAVSRIPSRDGKDEWERRLDDIRKRRTLRNG